MTRATEDRRVMGGTEERGMECLRGGRPERPALKSPRNCSTEGWVNGADVV